MHAVIGSGIYSWNCVGHQAISSKRTLFGANERTTKHRLVDGYLPGQVSTEAKPDTTNAC